MCIYECLCNNNYRKRGHELEGVYTEVLEGEEETWINMVLMVQNSQK